MNLPVPYNRKLTLLCVNNGGYGGLLRKWFPQADLIYTRWTPNLGEHVWMYEPSALIWLVKNQAMTYRHICSLRVEYPRLPIVLIHSRVRINRYLFGECKCSLVNVFEAPSGIGVEMQLAVENAYALVK